MEDHGFDFASEHVVDFHAVFATKAEADEIARMYVADHKAGDKLTNIETKPFDQGGMDLTLSKKDAGYLRSRECFNNDAA